MKNDQKPYHIEARELGVTDFRRLRVAKKNINAADLRSIWDYRSAGLGVDAAREYVARWNTRSYHRYPRGAKQVDAGPAAGRILCMAQRAKINLPLYREALKNALALPYASLDWSCPRVLWEVGDRAIITVREESVTWSDNRRHKWPTSSSISYTSYLIRTSEPGTIELYNMGSYIGVRDLAEKHVAHNLRGNWQTRVVRALLNIDYEQIPEIFYKQVAIHAGQYASIYDGSPYQIGEIRRERIMKNHNGGLYCYRTAEEAQNAVYPDRSVLLDAPRCILAVRVCGRKIRYDNGKYAVAEMTPVEVVR
jgi:hypothetical protein